MSVVQLALPAGDPSEHAVYRMYRADGRLLYVGMTNSIGKRLHQHDLEWGLVDVATVTVEQFPTREAAAAAEVRAIFTEHPLWNRMHNPKPAGTRFYRQPRPAPVPTAADYERWLRGEPVRRGGYVIEPQGAA